MAWIAQLLRTQTPTSEPRSRGEPQLSTNAGVDRGYEGCESIIAPLMQAAAMRRASMRSASDTGQIGRAHV